MVEETINIKVRADAAQLTKILKQLKLIQNKILSLSKSMTKFNTTLKSLSNRFGTVSKRITKANRSLKANVKSTNAAVNAARRLNKANKTYTSTTKKATTGTSKFNSGVSLMGFRMLALGGMATFAASRIRGAFLNVLEETSVILSEINRINLFSDLGIVNAKVDLNGFNSALERTIEIGNKFGIPFDKAATLLKQVEKSAPSNIDPTELGNITAGFSILESEFQADKLVAAFSTVVANFPEEKLESIGDKIFAFSKATKLTIGQGSNVIAFMSQSAKRLNADLDEVLRTLTVVVAVTPGERATAGRAGRSLIGDITEPDVLRGLEAMGVAVFDANDNFISMENVLDGLTDKFNSLSTDKLRNQFIKDLKLSRNSTTAFLALAGATEEVKAAAASQFVNIEGSLAAAVENQAQTAEATLNRFKNFVTKFKLDFSIGAFEGLGGAITILTDLFSDGSLSDSIKIFGKAIGETLVGGLKLLIPPLKFFADILKDNTPLVKVLANAVVGLTIALTGLGIIFLVAGSAAMLLSVYSKLAESSKLLTNLTNRLHGAYTRFFKIIGKGIGKVVTFMKHIGDNKPFRRFILNAKKAGLAVKAFALSAFRSFALIASGWIIALAPVIVAIAAFIGMLLLMRKFQTELIEIANSFDKTGTAARNLKGNLDGIFEFFATGNIDVFLDPLRQDFKDTETRFKALGEAWNIFVSDLKKSKIGTFISEQINNIKEFFGDIKTGIDNFIKSISFELPDVWQIFGALVTGLPVLIGMVGIEIDKLLKSLGFELPPVWGMLDGFLALIRERFKFLIDPITKFVDSLTFDVPPVFLDIQNALKGVAEEWNKLITTINDNPIVVAIAELFGIGGNFGKNIGRGFESAPDRGNFIPSLPTSFFPEAFGDTGDEGAIGLQGDESNDIAKKFNKYVEEAIEKGNPLGVSIEVQEDINKTSVNYDKTIIKTSDIFDKLTKQNKINIESTIVLDKFINENSIITKLLSATMNIQINDVIKNINVTSALSTVIAGVQVMFARLIAQGNRAAGKLASLRVSSTGKFSISDPGVSKTDREGIESAIGLLSSTKQNQVFLQPSIVVEINPTITLADGSQGELEGAANTLADELSSVLQKQIGNLTG